VSINPCAAGKGQKRGEIMKTITIGNLSTSVLVFLALFLFATVLTFAQTPTLHSNGQIAFTSNRDGNQEIYVMNADGTNQIRITNNPGIDDHAKWSPDVSKLAFVSERSGGGFAIFLMNADGTNKVEITPITYHLESWRVSFWSMSWSPFGDRIVFEDGDDIFVINIDGSGRLNLTVANSERDVSPAWSPDGSRILYSTRGRLQTVKPDGSNVRPLSRFGGGEYHASWSPSGDRLAFAVDLSDACFWVQAIYIADSDLTDRRIIHGGLCSPTLNFRPTWSPDGRKILFYIADETQADNAEIFVKNIDGTGLTQLTNTAGQNLNPSWQPLPLPHRNGKIAFTSDRDGNKEIYVMNQDGTNQVRLTNNNIVDDHPKWSPDGKKIAFLSQNASGTYGIFVMNPDGSGRMEITPVLYLLPSENQYPVWNMSWSPDGQQIVFSDVVSSITSTLIVVNANGSNRSILTSGFHPAWSPDGTKIGFVERNGSSWQLYTIRPDGTDLQNIPLSLSDYGPWRMPLAWSPDGRKIAFNVGDIGAPEIDIANADGSDRQIFIDACDGFVPEGGCPGSTSPAWSPNGRTIAFVNHGEVAVKNIGEEAITRLTNTAGTNTNPNWQQLAKAALFDFDGDGQADTSVFRPSDRIWYLDRSTDGFSATQFGLLTDTITPADYDGDGKTDIAVYRDGTWYLLRSTAGFGAVQFGLPGDIPVPADYTGDGRDELTVYRNGQWWALDLTNNQSSLVNFGLATDKPLAADYDGDGRADQAVYRDGVWHLNRSSQGYTAIQFGLSSDLPVVGDYDADGLADAAVYRGGTWYLLRSTEGFAAFQWGLSTDIPAPADYDGDGKTDAAVFRDGIWYQLTSTAGIVIQQFGLAGDKPVPAAYAP
jgi:Tol biopolymer transport system component